MLAYFEKTLNHKKLFLEAFSKYYDRVYKERLDISDYLNNVTCRWERFSWENPYVLSVIHEAIGIDISLINLINSIDRSTITICAWNEILKEYNDDESFELYCQFVESEVILAADAPYKVKSRFTYLTAYIIHHCLNCIDDNRKEIFKENIYLSDLKSLLNNEHLPKISTNTNRLYDSIDLIFHNEFQSDSHNLRNREHHRDGSSFLTEYIVKVHEKLDSNRRKSYRLSVQKPVTLDVLINALKKELKLCRQAYTEFEEFVTNAFENFEKYKVG